MPTPINDYSKIKTPFFTISVGDSYGVNMTPLPDDILRLVKKIEIKETYGVDEHSTINITFMEGSREPSRIYKSNFTSNSDGSATSIGNSSGFIADLKFSNYALLSDNKEVGIFNSLNALRNTIEVKEVQDEKIITTKQAKAANPKYLFQERNQIKVTWGYKEDSSSVRSIRMYVIMVSTVFNESAQTETTVTCQNTCAFLNQITPQGKPIVFAEVIKTGPNELLSEFKDKPTSALMSEISSILDTGSIISKNLPAPELDNHHVKVLISGESFDQFFKRLAKVHNCYYQVIPDNSTGRDTIIFMHATDFESQPIVDNPYTFYFKSPQSIIKNVSIKADFGIVTGVAETGVDQKGTIISQQADTGKDQLTLIQKKELNKSGSKSEQIINADPTSVNPIRAVKNASEKLGGGTKTGKVELSPIDNERTNYIDRSKVKAEDAHHGVILEMTTIGYTKLTPGLVVVRGIGERYSGSYRIVAVEHIIDNSGYSCKVTATTYATGYGLDEPEAKKISEKDTTPGIKIKNTTSDNLGQSLRDKYNSFLFKK